MKIIEDFKNTGSKSDKITQHGYHRFYPYFLSHLRHKKISLLEVGIEETESLKLWQGYFPKLNLYGIDIEAKQFNDKNVFLYQVDQSSSYQLKVFCQNIDVQFDVILDDGSHVPDHQLLTISMLWSVLKPGGVYIIEDIETSYWKKSQSYGYKFDSSRTSVISPFKELIDVINSEFSNARMSNQYLRKIASEIELMSFGQNCIILIKKDNAKFSEFYDRDYRSKQRINSRKLFSLFKRGYNKYVKLKFRRTQKPNGN